MTEENIIKGEFLSKITQQSRDRISQEKLEEERRICREKVLHQQKILKLLFEYFEECANLGMSHVNIDAYAPIKVGNEKFFFTEKDIVEFEEEFKKHAIEVLISGERLLYMTYKFCWLKE
jgi:hypothetical protein